MIFWLICLHSNQRDITRFLWLKDKTSINHDNIQEYRVFLVYFGVISSPFLLGATVKNHLSLYEYEIADNVISGTETVGDAMQFYDKAKTIFNDASLNLCEWTSNKDEVNRFILLEDITVTKVMLLDSILPHPVSSGNECDKSATEYVH